MTDPLDSALHSAAYFGDSRDHWWNRDFIALMAQRWGLGDVHTVLDAGCGVGHWGRVLAPVLPPTARLTGVDREPAWVAQATRRAVAAGLGERFTYTVGTVQSLPFPDGAFDLVTCQTVLIHVPDVRGALREMLRVLRPGGLLVLSEPSNIGSALVFDSVSHVAPVEDCIALARFHLVCERGKEALGEGNNSVGVMLPGWLAALGVEQLSVYLSDKASPLIPPYSSPEAQATVRELKDWTARDFWIWDKADTRRFFLAGGGTADEFAVLWSRAMDHRRAVCAAMDAGTYHAAGGGVSYLVAGRRPAVREPSPGQP